MERSGTPYVSFISRGNDVSTLEVATVGSEGISIDTVGAAMNDPSSLVFDAAGQPHVAYRAAHDWNLNDALKRATRVGSSWRWEVVDTSPTYNSPSDRRGNDASIAVAPDGIVHAAGMRIDHDWRYFYELRHFWRDVDGWHAEVVATIRGNDPEVSMSELKIDSHGVLHLAYTSRSDHGIYYARRDAAGWTFERVAGFQQFSTPKPTLAITADGVAHVAYIDGPLGGQRNVRHAVRQLDGWSNSIVGAELGAVTSEGLALATDDNGAAHFAFRAGGPDDLYWVRVSETGEFAHVVDEDPSFVWWSIAVGPGADPVVYVAYESLNLELKFAQSR